LSGERIANLEKMSECPALRNPYRNLKSEEISRVYPETSKKFYFHEFGFRRGLNRKDGGGGDKRGRLAGSLGIWVERRSLEGGGILSWGRGVELGKIGGEW
jgi:hypothetical protein